MASFSSVPGTRAEFQVYIREFIDREILPSMAEWEEQGSVPREFYHVLGREGLLALRVPSELGGKGVPFRWVMSFVAEICSAFASGVGSAFFLQINTICPLLVRFANPDIIARFLKPIMSGEVIGSLAVTEPTGGSDILGAVKTQAVDEGDSWVVNGEKKFITNSPIADVIFALVKTRPDDGPVSLSVLAIPASLEGVTVEVLPKLGQRASPIGHIRFQNVRVPRHNLLGRLNRGFFQVIHTMHEERFMIAYGAVKFAQACMAKALRYALTRKSGIGTLFDRQTVQYEFARHHAELAAAESFCESVGERIEAGQFDSLRMMMAKYAVTARALSAIEYCHSLYGAAALYEDHWAWLAIRDARVMSIYAGSSETMKDAVTLHDLPKYLCAGRYE